MRKSWKWALCLGVVSLLLLGGCGKEKTEPVDLVLVTDGSEVASDAVYQSAWNGLAQYGDESGLKYEASVPAGRTTEDYENTIKEAAQKGASVIVCAGTSMSRAVYDAQRDWKDVRFLLLEAEPVSESGRSRLRGNTESLEIDASEAGYLAGYAAVQAGYTHLGYIGQKNEENGTKNIHVVNSRGAATTQVLIARKLNEYASQGMPFEEVVDKIEEYTTSLRTYFVLETLEVLRKNGRLSRLSATIAGALNIKPVMIGTRDGVIQKAAQARGMKKALAKMVEHMGSEGRDLTRRQFVISHCNCYERAVYVKELIKKHLHAEDVDIVDTKGVSSLYACDGGIIVSY